MPQGDPVNTLAQFWLWRLELRVVSTAVGVVRFGAKVLVTWAFGVNTGVAFMFALFGGLALFLVYAVLRFLWLLVSPAARDRELQKNEDRYRREMAAIHRNTRMPGG